MLFNARERKRKRIKRVRSTQGKGGVVHTKSYREVYSPSLFLSSHSPTLYVKSPVLRWRPVLSRSHSPIQRSNKNTKKWRAVNSLRSTAWKISHAGFVLLKTNSKGDAMTIDVAGEIANTNCKRRMRQEINGN